jgi:two-component system cell cycle sensor histidine kinase/response regulator CckA
MAGSLKSTGHSQSPPFPSPTLAEDILQAIQTLVVVLNGDGHAVYVSPSIERILGFSVWDVMGERYFDVVRSSDTASRLKQREQLSRAARGEIPVAAPYTVKLLTVSGQERVILWQDAKGPGDLLIGVGQDITDLRKAEQEAASRDAEFRAIFEASSEGMLILNSDWVYLKANPAACQIFGLVSEAVVGQAHGSLLKSSVDVTEVRQRAMAEGGFTGEAAFQRTDGATRQVEYSIVPFFRENHHLIIMRDITERRSLEMQLSQAQKLEAIGRLAGGVAHDFNNMLTAIRGYGELLLKNYPEGRSRRYVEGILGASERAAQTTHQLLAFSRRQVLVPKLLDVNGAVTETLDLLRRVIGEDVELMTILSPNAGRILVDPGQFSQLLMNLAVNSRDAMPKGGKLIIETRCVYLTDDYVLKHIQVKAGEYVMLAVTDTGVGIAPETREHIFEPFFTTKPQGEGTGLGLSMVYGIVKQSGGYVWVYSEPGEGSTFKIYFPKAEAGNDPWKAAPKDVSLNVLVIEDDEVLRSLTGTVLREHGHNVREAVDGSGFLKDCERITEPIDLVITDVTSPGMSGEDLMGYFAVKHPRAAIIHMSGFPHSQLAGTQIPKKAFFLAKPFTLKELLQIVEQVLEGRSRARLC